MRGRYWHRSNTRKKNNQPIQAVSLVHGMDKIRFVTAVLIRLSLFVFGLRKSFQVAHLTISRLINGSHIELQKPVFFIPNNLSIGGTANKFMHTCGCIRQLFRVSTLIFKGEMQSPKTELIYPSMLIHEWAPFN